MKKLELGQTITILANVGVIAGIVFLAIEPRQNNELLGVQIRSGILDRQTAAPDLIQDSGGPNNGFHGRQVTTSGPRLPSIPKAPAGATTHPFAAALSKYYPATE